jgi:hypothetical protein
VPGDQEGEHLAPDVDVVEPAARFLIDARKHIIEQIDELTVRVGGMFAFAFFDDLIGDRLHIMRVGLKLA